MAKRRVEIREGKFFSDKVKQPEPVKFFDFYKQYLEWAKANKKISGYQRLLSLMRQVNKEFGIRTIQEITTWQIEKYKAKWKEEVKKPRRKDSGKTAKDVSQKSQAKIIKPATVNRELALLKHMFTKAIEWGMVKENPTKRVKLLKGEVKRVRYLMPDEVQVLLSNCEEDILRPLVTVAVHTGMRKSELFNLKRDEMNVERGVVSILDTKNHERRDIPMNDTVKVVLKGMPIKGEYVFCNADGAPLKYHSVRKPFEKAVKESGIKDFRFHDLRHTFASNLAMTGEDLNTIRELLEHKDLTMTLRYAHLSPKHKTKAVNILDGIFNRPQFNPQSDTAEKVVSIKGSK